MGDTFFAGKTTTSKVLVVSLESIDKSVLFDPLVSNMTYLLNMGFELVILNRQTIVHFYTNSEGQVEEQQWDRKSKNKVVVSGNQGPKNILDKRDLAQFSNGDYDFLLDVLAVSQDQLKRLDKAAITEFKKCQSIKSIRSQDTTVAGFCAITSESTQLSTENKKF